MSLWGSVGLLLSAALVLSGLLFASLLGPWARLRPSLRPVFSYRRPAALVSFVLMGFHLGLVSLGQFGADSTQAVRAISPYFGVLGFVLLGLFVLTGWDLWREHVSWNAWHVMHAILLACFLFSIIVTQIQWSEDGGAPTWATYALGGFLLFWTAIAPWAVAPSSRSIRGGWRQLSLLLLPATCAFWIHAYVGPFSSFPAARILLILLAVCIVGSHVVEWVYAFHEKRRSTSEEQHAPWYDAVAFSVLTHRGSRVEIAGISLACFLHDDRPVVFYGYCSREPNPLWLGFIHRGELHCPWHGCRYSVLDGSSTRGLQEAVHRFDTKIIEGRVWVKIPKRLTV